MAASPFCRCDWRPPGWSWGFWPFYPEVVGNGQALITGLVHEDYGTREALVLLLVKVSAVAVVFGCGTVGGAMTPTLYVGSMVGLSSVRF